MMLKKLLKTVSRRKITNKNVLDTELKRCLNLFDLTMFGFGGMIGSGIFVVAGTLTKDVAGPAIVLSFLFGGVAAFLSALSYAELGTLYPKAGSSYSYTYYLMGELVAFMLGWTMLLEGIIAIASVSKAVSGSLDSVFDGAIKNFTIEHIGKINLPVFADYPDFVAVLNIFLWSAILSLGAKVSSYFNSFITIFNIFLLFFIIGFGIYFSDFKYWNSNGIESFMPHGFSGVISASALCFYTYAGFEYLSAAAEEAKNPKKNIPSALAISMVFCSLLFIAVSGSLSLLLPLDSIDITAPFPSAFKFHNFILTGKVVASFTVLGISVCLASATFTLNRTMYAMAEDGLLFSQFAYVHPTTKTPLVSIAVSAVLTSFIALIVSLETLVSLYSTGAILATIFVSLDLLSYRYTPDANEFQQFDSNSNLLTSQPNTANESMSSDENSADLNIPSDSQIGTLKPQFFSLFGTKYLIRANVGLVGGLGIAVSSSAIFLLKDSLVDKEWWAVVLVIVFVVCFIGFLGLLIIHQHRVSSTTFQVPFVPFTPVLSIFINTYLLLNLKLVTWIRFFVWLAIGLLVYFGYGMRNSKMAIENPSISTAVNYTDINGSQNNTKDSAAIENND